MSALASYIVVNSAQRTSGTHADFEIQLAHTALRGVRAVELVSVQIPLDPPEDEGSGGEGEPEPSPLANDLYVFIRIKEFSPLQLVESRSGEWATFYVPCNGATTGVLSYEPTVPQRAVFTPMDDILIFRVQLIRFASGAEVVSLAKDWAFVLKVYH